MSLGDSYESLTDALWGGEVDPEEIVEAKDRDRANALLGRLRHTVAAFSSDREVVEAELARADAWLEERRIAAQTEIDRVFGILERFMRAVNREQPKVKTVKLPNGELTLRAQQDEWEFDQEVFGQWAWENGRADLLRFPDPVPSVVIDAAKAAFTVGEGKDRFHGEWAWVCPDCLHPRDIDEEEHICPRCGTLSTPTRAFGPLPPGVKVFEREDKFDAKPNLGGA